MLNQTAASAPAGPQGPEPERSKRLNPVLIFFIGCFAAVCAVFLPKLVVLLNQRVSDSLIVMTPSYAAIGMAFAALLGFGVVIFEWNKQSKPSEVFMTALGLPALISGAFNTSGTADNLRYEIAQREQTFVQAAAAASVPILDPRDLQAKPRPEKQGAGFGWISSAAAAQADGDIVLAQAAFGVMAKPKAYYVVLAQTADPAQAQARLQAIRARVPDATIQHLGAGYLVTSTARPLPEQAALSEARRMQQAGQGVSLAQASE